MGRRADARARAIRWCATAVALLGAFAPSLARAEWFRAETDRFVVYGEGREQKVRDYAVKLTTFDHVLRLFHPQTLKRVPATKVNVYLVDSGEDLRRVRPGTPREVAGVYIAMNEGVFAIAVSSADLGDDVTFHEYAHHFMLENFPAAYPAWFVEGWAEYFMTTEIRGDQIKVGGYNEARVYGMFQQSWVPLGELLTKTTAETRPDRRGMFYAEAWLLMHYMRSDPKRAEQLSAITRAIAEGQSPVKAFESTTGLTLDQLTAQLKRYNKLPVTSFKDPSGAAASVNVTPLPKSADDLLLENLRLIMSDTGKVDGDFLSGVRRKAAKYPGDRLAETTLARAEFVMGDVAAGEGIMNARLAAHPDDVEDLLLAGTGQVLAGMRDRPNRQARYRAARPMLAKAYKLDGGDFRTLYAYALSRSIEPGFPTDNDINVLLEAQGLAPSVQENAVRAGLALIQKGRKDEARRLLTPLINNPHGGAFAARAKALLEGSSTSAELDPASPAKVEPAEPAP